MSEEIKNTILNLYKSFEDSDIELFKSITHPEVRTVNIGNSNESFVFGRDEIINNTILGLKNVREQVPGFYAKWVEVQVKSIKVHDRIASAEVIYKMDMPESYGNHSSFIQFIKEDIQWQIIEIIDRGIEIKGE